MSDSSLWRNSMVMAPSRGGIQQTQGHKPRPSTSHPRTGRYPPDRDYLEGLIDEPLQTIDVPENDPKQEDIRISNCSYIGSYNWMTEDSCTPAIVVPGMVYTTRLRILDYEYLSSRA